MLCAAATLALGAPEAPARQPAGNFERAVLIPVEGPITPQLKQSVFRRLEMARERGADLVIMEIDSPGGLLEESFALANRLQELDWARTVAYVPEQALSGAAIMALGADEIVMHPDARLGDAGPIFMDEHGMFQHAPEKILSDLAVRMRTLAESQGRPPALAEAMVDRNLEVYHVRHRETGEETYMSEAEIKSADDPEAWEKVNPNPIFESRKDHFLEVTGSRAVELGLAEATVEGRDELKRRYGITELEILEHTWVDTLVDVLNSGWVTVLLLVVGLVSLYIEFSAPGMGIGLLLALLCFALFFWSRVLGGTAGWLEIILFLTGAGFIAAEIFLFPGFGFPGITGALLLLLSFVMASQRFVIPRTDYDFRELLNTLGILVGSAALFLVAAVVLRKYFGVIPGMGYLVLEPPAAEPAPTAGAANVEESWRESLVGQEGVAVSALRPAGKARFGDKSIDVVAEGSYILPGRSVRVVEVSGNRVIVVEV